ncbi:laccase [Sarocladium strictum]
MNLSLPINSGVIRHYDFTISRGVIAPDGYQRDVLLVNDQFPGPLIEANWGDTIQVTLRNNITEPEEGTALHWHGILQKDRPWQDGVPAVTQCPVAPGKKFTYSFVADLYGSSWYHSHYSGQYAGGLFGPMVIYGPGRSKYDVDLGPILLSDWYHPEYFDLVEQVMTPGAGPPRIDNNLINGKNNFNCSALPAGDKTPCTSDAGLSKFKFKKNKTHRLRLINSGADGLQRFTIDGHKMTVIANDFVPVEPYETDVVTLGIGQRTDVLVKADKKPGAYWMRSTIPSACGLAQYSTKALATIHYEGTDDKIQPTSEPWEIDEDFVSCSNDDLSKTKPLMKLKTPKADKFYDMNVEFFVNATGHLLFKMDGTSFRGNFNSPTLLLSNLGNTTFDPIWNVKNTKQAKSVRVHVHNKTPISHPMHLHGFNMYILDEGVHPEGVDTWDGKVVNPNNPQRRDVQMLRPNGYIVMQFDAAGNPGVWPFHCHIAWHVSAGLFTQFLTEPAKVKKFRIPNTVAETCRQWGKYTKINIPEQIDSGL